MQEIYFDRKGNSHKKSTSSKVKNRVSAYGIFKKEDKILLIMNNWSTKFELPGGGKKKSETLLGCLKREFKEETGFIPTKIIKTPLEVIKSNFYADDLNQYFKSKMYFFKIEEVKETKSKTDKSEIKKVVFLPLEMISRKNVKENQVNFILNKKN